MKVHRAEAKGKEGGWYIHCPGCRTRMALDRPPESGGMEANIETCSECGADIQVHPLKTQGLDLELRALV
jgi:transcription initiation factor IIE alpha subunit